MGKRGPKASEDGEERDVRSLRLSRLEQSQIERVRAERGDQHDADTIRALGLIWREREILMRAALDLLRGRYSAGEIGLVIDALNGCAMLAGIDIDAGGLPDLRMLGHHVALEVHDCRGGGEKWECGDEREVGARLHGEPLVARIALELWVAWLWSRHDDDELWDRERAWLASASTPSA